MPLRQTITRRVPLPLRRPVRRPRWTCPARQPFGAVTAAVADSVSQATRANLVSQYNQIITQITTTAQDASFNGINLLNGDSLKLVFDETGKSTSTITGVTFNPAGLGLSCAHLRHRLHRQRRDQHRSDDAQHRQHHAAVAGVGLRRQPVDRADPPGLQQEPDQRAADRFVRADARRLPTRKRPTARRCRPASRSRPRRCRSPTSRSRAFCSSCADPGETSANAERRGFGPAVFFCVIARRRSYHPARRCAVDVCLTLRSIFTVF